MSLKDYRFGIEIELTGITRSKAANVIAEHFGTRAMGETATDRTGRRWCVKYDGSIKCQKKSEGRTVSANSTYSVEVVSPILGYDDIDDLQKIIRCLRKAGAFVNNSTGIHIHCDKSNHSPKTLKNLLNLMIQKQELIFKSLKVKESRQTYCKSINEDMVKLINKKKPETFAQLGDLWYSSLNATTNRGSHYNSSRYHIVNLHSVFSGQTVEFRCFNSSVHAGEVKSYIQFVLALNHQALTQKKTSFRKTVSDNEKYSMRCWLLRLGLIGEEFATCRHHMLKNLEGDSAFRHGRPQPQAEQEPTQACLLSYALAQAYAEADANARVTA